VKKNLFFFFFFCTYFVTIFLAPLLSAVFYFELSRLSSKLAGFGVRLLANGPAGYETMSFCARLGMLAIVCLGRELLTM
jgi:hypothetical protein